MADIRPTYIRRGAALVVQASAAGPFGRAAEALLSCGSRPSARTHWPAAARPQVRGRCLGGEAWCPLKVQTHAPPHDATRVVNAPDGDSHCGDEKLLGTACQLRHEATEVAKLRLGRRLPCYGALIPCSVAAIFPCSAEDFVARSVRWTFARPNFRAEFCESSLIFPGEQGNRTASCPRRDGRAIWPRVRPFSSGLGRRPRPFRRE
jgi:hypothetical protein